MPARWLSVKKAAGRAAFPARARRETDTDFIRHPEQWVLDFSVRDTGIRHSGGTGGTVSLNLFSRWTTPRGRHYGGTGLGLAISKTVSPN